MNTLKNIFWMGVGLTALYFAPSVIRAVVWLSTLPFTIGLWIIGILSILFGGWYLTSNNTD